MENLHKPYGPYERFIKRPLDFMLSVIALVVLSPLLLILAIVGAIAMKGNPFFVQRRPGRIDKKTGREKIFSLIKFRTMSNAKDKDGRLLPDDERLNKYGRFLRSTSLDELPELINIIAGQMAVVGPRPLLPEYLPYYTEEERHRHDVKPGLTGLAQAHGRNELTWEEKFALDEEYVRRVTFAEDIRVVFATVRIVLTGKGINAANSFKTAKFTGAPRKVARYETGKAIEAAR